METKKTQIRLKAGHQRLQKNLTIVIQELLQQIVRINLHLIKTLDLLTIKTQTLALAEFLAIRVGPITVIQTTVTHVQPLVIIPIIEPIRIAITTIIVVHQERTTQAHTIGVITIPAQAVRVAVTTQEAIRVVQAEATTLEAVQVAQVEAIIQAAVVVVLREVLVEVHQGVQVEALREVLQDQEVADN